MGIAECAAEADFDQCRKFRGMEYSAYREQEHAFVQDQPTQKPLCSSNLQNGTENGDAGADLL